MGRELGSQAFVMPHLGRDGNATREVTLGPTDQPGQRMKHFQAD